MRIDLTKNKIATVHSYAVRIKERTEQNEPLNPEQVKELFELAEQLEDFTNSLVVAAQSGFAKIEIE